METSHTHKNTYSCSSSSTSIPSHRRMMNHFKQEIIILGFNIIVFIVLAGCGGGTVASAQSPRLVSNFTGFNKSDLLIQPTNSTSAFGPDGSLVLDASTSTTGIATALYDSPVSIYDPETGLVSSFLTTFTFSTSSNHSFSTNGTLAFVLVSNTSVQDESSADSEGIDRVSIEFATACKAYDDSGGDIDREFGHGFPAVSSGFQVSEWVKNSSIQPLLPSWPGLLRYTGEISCRSVQYNPSSSDDDSDSSAENVYQLFVEYNASSRQIVAGSVPACFPGGASGLLPRGSFVRFSAHNLSADVFSGYPYIGFAATNGGVYRISQWNFTTSDTGAYTSLVFSSIGTGTQRSSGGSSTSSSGLYGNARIVVIVSSCVIGASILVGVLFLVFIWRRKRDRRHMVGGGGGGVMMKGGLPPPPPVSSTSAITHTRGPVREHVFIPDAAPTGKCNDVMMNFEAGPMPPEEHDTLPLTRNASYASTDTMSWHLPPPVPR